MTNENKVITIWLATITLLVGALLLVASPVQTIPATPTSVLLAQPTGVARFGVSWDDLRIEPIARTGQNAPTFEQWLTNGAGSRGTYCYTFHDDVLASEDEIFFNIQLPHAWKLGTPIHMHVHWIGKSTIANSAVVWGLEYSGAEPITGVFTNTQTMTTTNREGYTAPYTTTKWAHYLTEFTPITSTTNTDNVSTIYQMRLWRNSSAAADTYTDDVCLLYVDGHVILDSIGSVSELNK